MKPNRACNLSILRHTLGLDSREKPGEWHHEKSEHGMILDPAILSIDARVREMRKSAIFVRFHWSLIPFNVEAGNSRFVYKKS
jgi:hypothetical protein